MLILRSLSLMPLKLAELGCLSIVNLSLDILQFYNSRSRSSIQCLLRFASDQV